MAIINCPSCHEQISDKAKVCSHCRYSKDQSNSPEIGTKDSVKGVSQSSLKIQRIKTIQSLQSQTMLALLLSIAGFVFYYWDGIDDKLLQQWVGMGTIIIGMVWYFVNRVRMNFLTRKIKKLRK